MESVTPSNGNRIRILKFVNQFFIGGTEQQFVHVANGLDRSRFAVELGCFKREGPLLDSLEPDLPVHIYPLHGSLYNWRSLVSQFRLMNDVRKRRFDIVHAWGWYPNIFAIPASRAARRPIIIASIRDAGAYMTPVKIKALKLACRLADCVVANSKAGRDWIVEQGVNEDKTVVLRNGIFAPPRIDKRTHGGGVRDEFGIPAGTPVCACVGRLVSGKGIDFFLRAARILAERGRDVRFLMVGAHSAEQNYQWEMQDLVRELSIGHRVIFTGQRQDVREILRDVDILVHPSLTEGLSNVIMEAMAASIPVIATRVGGNPELVEDGRTGLLVPPRDAEEIANAVCLLLDQPQMARDFGERARQRILDEFTMERMLSKTQDLYLKLSDTLRRS